VPLVLKAGAPVTVPLFIADDPAKAGEVSVEILCKCEGGTGAPAFSINGQILGELKSTRDLSDLTLSLSSAALKSALKRGTNDFTFTSAAGITVTAVSVRVVP
jgi:hypothetical protein